MEPFDWWGLIVGRVGVCVTRQTTLRFHISKDTEDIPTHRVPSPFGDPTEATDTGEPRSLLEW